ncbi:MAG TPA: hypothetical protein VL096_10340 [Pirellulaceae bacterium]|nr:hypothetical protein [Pirellulaceae bacterium]
MKIIAFTLLGILTLAGCGDSFRATRGSNETPPVLGEGDPQVGSAPGLQALEGDSGVRSPAPASGAIKTGIPRSAGGHAAALQYDPSTEITLTGDIVGRREVRMDSDSDRRAVIVRLHSGGEILPVYVGPIDWLSSNDVPVEMTKKIVVRGSRVDLNGEMVLMARTIDVGAGEVQLRDANGSPYWTVPALE